MTILQEWSVQLVNEMTILCPEVARREPLLIEAVPTMSRHELAVVYDVFSR